MTRCPKILFGLAVIVSAATSATVFAQSDALSLHVLFGADELAGNVNDIRRRAAALPLEDRYEYLKAWVLPSKRHPDFRILGEFVPTDPSPLARQLEPHRFPSERGGELVAPVFDLLAVARETGRLEELFAAALAMPVPPESADARAKLVVAIMIRLEQDRTAGVSELLKQLHELDAKAFARKNASFLPELLLLDRGIRHHKAFEQLGDMLVLFFEQRFTLDVADEWETHLASMLGRYQEYIERGELAPTDEPQTPKDWIPVQRSTAYTRGTGYPPLLWRLNGDREVRLLSGHQRDYLFYRSPLSGDFEVAGELLPHGNSQIMVGGHYCGLKGDGKRIIVGRFREGDSLLEIDPPFRRHDPWAQYRAIVRGGQLTVNIHGRSLFEKHLGNSPDPWLALRGVAYSGGEFRHLRITGSPEIPRSISMSSSKTLSDWIPYYFQSETAGTPGSTWQLIESPDGVPQILGRKRDRIAGSSFESLLRYQRPLAEDGSIEYDFVYIPGKVHAHPALDRLVFLMDPEGVRLHWLTDGRFDRTDVAPENRLDEPENRRGPARLPLREKQLNHMKLAIVGRTVSIELNGLLIYQRQLEPANQRTFGLFHYADRTALAVRNVVMRGEWPKMLPPPYEQELADPKLATLERSRDRLGDEFRHDFVQDGLPEKYFKRTGKDAEQAIQARADGVHIDIVSSASPEWASASIVPRFSLEGDFDLEARFEGFQFDETLDDAIAFAHIQVDDKLQHYVRAMRGWDQASGHNARSQISPLPVGGRRAFLTKNQMDWTTSGRLRIARAGDEFHIFYAPEETRDFRIVQSRTISDAEIPMDGVLLQLALRGQGRGQVVWKELSIKAERIRYLAPEQKPTRKLFTMSPDGKNLRELAAPRFGLDHLGSPEFSSDGSRIVMDMSKGSVANSRIIIMNRDGSDMKDLGPGCMPSLSRDGKSIVFTDPDTGIVKMDADGKNRKTIEASGWGVQYSPDGKLIAVGMSSNMALIDVKTGKKTLLLEGDVAKRYSLIYWNFGWSHDSQAIAFKGQRRETAQQELAVIDINEPDQIEVLYSGSGIYEDFTFSPNSQSVLFALGQEGPTESGLYLAHRKTPGQIERLKGQPDDFRILDCDWSPDGKEIVFAALVDPVPVEWPLAAKETGR